MPVVNPRVPEGLRDLMKGLTKEVLREKPLNIYEFSANFFESMLHEKHDCTVKRYEPTIAHESGYLNRERHQIPVALVFKIIPEKLTELIKEFIKAVLRANPSNICKFGVEYFRRLQKDESLKNGDIQYTAYDNYFKSKDRLSFTPYVKCTCGRTFGEGIVQVTDVKKNTIEENIGQYKNGVLEDLSVAKCMGHLTKAMEAPSAKENSPNFESKPKQFPKNDSENNSVAKVHDEATIKAIYVIQRFYRSWISRKKTKDFSKESLQTNSLMSEEAAAIIIQRSLRKLFKQKLLKSEKHFTIIPNIENIQHLEENNENNSEAASYTSASTVQLGGESVAETMDREYFEVDRIVSEEQAVTLKIEEEHKQQNYVAAEIVSCEQTKELTADRAENELAHLAAESLIKGQNESESSATNNLTIFAEKDSKEEKHLESNMKDSEAINYSCKENDDRSLETIKPTADLTERTPSVSLVATDLEELPSEIAHSSKDSNVDSTEEQVVGITMHDNVIEDENQNHKNTDVTSCSVDMLKENTLNEVEPICSTYSEGSNESPTSIEDNIAEHEKVSIAVDEAHKAEKDEVKNGDSIKKQDDDANTEMTSQDKILREAAIFTETADDLSKVIEEKDTPKMKDSNGEEDRDAQPFKKEQSFVAVDSLGKDLCNENTEDSQNGNEVSNKDNNSAKVEGSAVEFNKNGTNGSDTKLHEDEAQEETHLAAVNEGKAEKESKDSVLLQEITHVSADLEDGVKLIQIAEINADSITDIEGSEGNENCEAKQTEAINEIDAEVNNKNENLSFNAEEHVSKTATNSQTHEESNKSEDTTVNEYGNGKNSESIEDTKFLKPEVDFDYVLKPVNEINKLDNARKASDLVNNDIEVVSPESLDKQDSEHIHEGKLGGDAKDLSLEVINNEDVKETNNHSLTSKEEQVPPNGSNQDEAAAQIACKLKDEQNSLDDTEAAAEPQKPKEADATYNKSTSIETVGEDTKILSNKSIADELTESDKHEFNHQHSNDKVIKNQSNSPCKETVQQESIENFELEEESHNGENVENAAKLESISADNLSICTTEEPDIDFNYKKLGTEASDTPKETLAKNDIVETLNAEKYDSQYVEELHSKRSLDKTQLQDECDNLDVDESITKQVTLQEENDVQKEDSVSEKHLDNEELSSNDIVNESNINLNADVVVTEDAKEQRNKNSLDKSKIEQECGNLECNETISAPETMQEVNILQKEESLREKLEANEESTLTDLSTNLEEGGSYIDESKNNNGDNEISKESNKRIPIQESHLEEQFGNEQNLLENWNNSSSNTNSRSLHNESDEAQHDSSPKMVQNDCTANTKTGLQSPQDVNSDNSSKSKTPFALLSRCPQELLMAEIHLKSFQKAKDVENRERLLNIDDEINATKIRNENTAQEPTLLESVDDYKKNDGNANSNESNVDILAQNETALAERPERSATYLYGFHTPHQSESPVFKSGPKSYTAFDIPNKQSPKKINHEISPNYELKKLNLAQPSSNDDVQSEIDLETPTILFAELNMFDDIAMEETILAEEAFSKNQISLQLNIDSDFDLNDAEKLHTPPNGLLNTIIEQNEIDTPRQSDTEISYAIKSNTDNNAMETDKDNMYALNLRQSDLEFPYEIRMNTDNNPMETNKDNMNALNRSFEPFEIGSGSENDSDITSSWSCSKETDDNFFSDEFLNESSNESVPQLKIRSSNLTSDGTTQGGVYEMAPIDKALVDTTDDKMDNKITNIENIETKIESEIVDKNEDLETERMETKIPTETTEKEIGENNLKTENTPNEMKTSVEHTNSILRLKSVNDGNDLKPEKIKDSENKSMKVQFSEIEAIENDSSNVKAEYVSIESETKFSGRDDDLELHKINIDPSLLADIKSMEGELSQLTQTAQKQNNKNKTITKNGSGGKSTGVLNKNLVNESEFAAENTDIEIDKINDDSLQGTKNKSLEGLLDNDKNHTDKANRTSENAACKPNSNSNSFLKSEIKDINNDSEPNDLNETSPVVVENKSMEVELAIIAEIESDISTFIGEIEPSEKEISKTSQNLVSEPEIMGKNKGLALNEKMYSEYVSNEKETGVLNDKNISSEIGPSENGNGDLNKNSVTVSKFATEDTIIEVDKTNSDPLHLNGIKTMGNVSNSLATKGTKQVQNDKNISSEFGTSENGNGDLNKNSVTVSKFATEDTIIEVDKTNSDPLHLDGIKTMGNVSNSLATKGTKQVQNDKNISSEFGTSENGNGVRSKNFVTMSKSSTEDTDIEVDNTSSDPLHLDGIKTMELESTTQLSTQGTKQAQNDKNISSEIGPSENGNGDLSKNSVTDSKFAAEDTDIEVNKTSSDPLHLAEIKTKELESTTQGTNQVQNDKNILFEIGSSENGNSALSKSFVTVSKFSTEDTDKKVDKTNSEPLQLAGIKTVELESTELMTQVMMNILSEHGSSENGIGDPNKNSVTETKFADKDTDILEVDKIKDDSLLVAESKSMEVELTKTAVKENDKHNVVDKNEPIGYKSCFLKQNLFFKPEIVDTNKDLELDIMKTVSLLGAENQLMKVQVTRNAEKENDKNNTIRENGSSTKDSESFKKHDSKLAEVKNLRTYEMKNVPLVDTENITMKVEFTKPTEMENYQNNEIANIEANKVESNELVPHKLTSDLVMGTANNLLDEIFTKIEEQNNKDIKKSITSNEEEASDPKKSVILSQVLAENNELELDKITTLPAQLETSFELEVENESKKVPLTESIMLENDTNNPVSDNETGITNVTADTTNNIDNKSNEMNLIAVDSTFVVQHDVAQIVEHVENKKQGSRTEFDLETTKETTIVDSSIDFKALRSSFGEHTHQPEAEDFAADDTDFQPTSSLTKHDLDFMADTISELKTATLALNNIEELLMYAPTSPTNDPLEVDEQKNYKEILQSTSKENTKDVMKVTASHSEDAHFKTANATKPLLLLVQSAIIIQNAFRKYITRKKVLAQSKEKILQQETVTEISAHIKDMENIETSSLKSKQKQNYIDAESEDSINKGTEAIESEAGFLTDATVNMLEESQSQKHTHTEEDLDSGGDDNSIRGKRSIDPMHATTIPSDESIDDKKHRVKVDWYVGEEPMEVVNVSAKPETIPKDIEVESVGSALVDIDTNTSSLPNPNASIETATSPSINSIPAAKVDKSTSSLLQFDSKTITNNTNLKSSDNIVSALEMNDDLQDCRSLKELDKPKAEDINSKSADLLQTRYSNSAENVDEQEEVNTYSAQQAFHEFHTEQDEETGNNVIESGNIDVAEEDTANTNGKQEADKTNLELYQDDIKAAAIKESKDALSTLSEDRKEDIASEKTHKEKQDLKDALSGDTNSNCQILLDCQPAVPNDPETAVGSETRELMDLNKNDDSQPLKDLDLATEFINSRNTKHWNISSKDAKHSEENDYCGNKHSIMAFINSEKRYWESDIPYSNLEEPCVKKSVSLSRLETEDENIESSSSEAHSNASLADPDHDEADSLGAKTEKLRETDAIIKKMQQRRASETRAGSMDERLSQEASFDEPIIKSMQELHNNNSTEVEDNVVIVLKRLQREETRESSGQSDSVVYGVDNNKNNEDNLELDQTDIKKASLQRLYTIPGDDAKMLFKSVTIDETVKYIEPPESETTATSGSSFCLDEDTSENIRQKMMAYSLSEADSEYLGAEATGKSLSMDRPSQRNDDFDITTALVDMTGTSTDTESTIVSAVTKIQAGARGFLTRRRLRRASLGTKSSLLENSKASFGNAAIDESLEKLVEEEAARKIQAAFRKHYRQNGISSLPTRGKETVKDINLNSPVVGEELETYTFSSFESPLAARRHTLQRGDAMRNDSTPDGNGSSRNDSSEKSLSPENAVETIETLKKEKSKISSIESTTSAAAAAVSSNKIKNELKWIAQRQHSMPVQIESEVFRVIPKHMRKRIKSADGEKKKRPRVLKD